MTRLSALCVAAFVFLLPQALSPQNNPTGEAQIGDFRFNMPAGWTQNPSDNSNAGIIAAPSTTPGRVTVIMLSTSPLQNTLKDTYEKQLSEMQKNFKVQPTGEPVPRELPGGYRALTVGAVISNPNGTQLAAVYVLARNGDRAEGLLFLTNDSEPNALAAHKAALESVVASLRFTSPEGASSAPSGIRKATPDPGAEFSLPPGIVPPDSGDSSSDSPARGGRSTASASADPPLKPLSTTPGGPARFAAIFRAPAKKGEDPTENLAIADPAANTPRFKFLVFFPDGRAKRGLIQSGFNETIQESSMRLDISSGGKFAMQWGMYQFGGGHGKIQFASAIGGQQLVSGLRGDVWNVVQYPDHLEMNGDIYLRLECPKGLTLNGTYKPFHDPKQAGIRFTSDGEFIDQGILDTHSGMAIGLAGGGVGIAYGFSSPKAGRGTYTISGYGLHLHYANGVAPSPVFFIEAGSSPDNVRVLYIANVRYHKVQEQQ